MSLFPELNRGPLPYHGSALPLSYIGTALGRSSQSGQQAAQIERETRFELATLSLEG